MEKGGAIPNNLTQRCRLTRSACAASLSLGRRGFSSVLAIKAFTLIERLSVKAVAVKCGRPCRETVRLRTFANFSGSLINDCFFAWSLAVPGRGAWREPNKFFSVCV
jgi:hypothetical protein